ncbi:MAG: hypothetical protein GF308_21140 [Candidatus Heimdallarchaeota archaeon]|nr:hypothetical protein [Candidatus Heimdallarchaeota archaeon]
MPPENDQKVSSEIKKDADELTLELHKEEKETKPPMPVKKLILIFSAAFVIAGGLAVGIAAIVYASNSEGWRDFSEWVSIFLMFLWAITFFAGGISGFWGGQRKIPIRIVNPSNNSVVGKGVIFCGYTIEDCLDNEIELTVYESDEEIVYEELVPVNENGIFYSKLEKAFDSFEKTTKLSVEAWMVSTKSKQTKFLVKNEKLKQMNIVKEGIKIGNWHLFPTIYQDFADKAEIIFDPKRKEKGVIEKVSDSEGGAVNIFFPDSQSEDKVIPFSFEALENMQKNALYFDMRRSRRHLYSLMFFIMAFLYFSCLLILALT